MYLCIQKRTSTNIKPYCNTAKQHIMTNKNHWLIFDITENVRISISRENGIWEIDTTIYDKYITPELTSHTIAWATEATALKAIRNLFRTRHSLYNYITMT